jgi:hypothetical protein
MEQLLLGPRTAQANTSDADMKKTKRRVEEEGCIPPVGEGADPALHLMPAE